MKGEYKIQLQCPSCKKRIVVIASVTDGKCPECQREISALQLFIHKDKAETASTVNIIVSHKNHTYGSDTVWIEKEIKRKNIGLGSMVISKLFERQEFIVISQEKKQGNKCFTCLPVIKEENRSKYDRYVYSIEKGTLAVFNRKEQVFDYCIEKAVKQLSDKALLRLQQAYKKYKINMPKKKERERYNVAPYDGFRNGNAWEGIVTVPGRIKVFRG